MDFFKDVWEEIQGFFEGLINGESSGQADINGESSGQADINGESSGQADSSDLPFGAPITIPGTGSVRDYLQSGQLNSQDSSDLSSFLDYIRGLGASVGAENEKNRTFNEQQAAIQRDFEASETQKARDYNTYMSNTTYQRMVSDLQQAGLNPALALSNGGLSTPASPAATGSAASYQTGGGDTFAGILNSIAGITSAISNFLPSNKVVQVIKSLGAAVK